MSRQITVGGVKIRGLDCFHDDAQGARRGRNIAFILEGDGLRVAHLGDLGHMPTPEMYEALRGVDILLIPIGGTYTITTPEAAALIREVKPTPPSPCTSRPCCARSPSPTKGNSCA